MQGSHVFNDWNVDVEPPETIKCPSFIQLFVTRRVLISCNVDYKHSNMIDKLVNSSEINTKSHRQVKEVLSLLLSDGIKKYVQKSYNEKTQANIIQTIFDQITLKHFEKECENVIKYNKQNDGINRSLNLYQNVLFNTSDIMCI